MTTTVDIVNRALQAIGTRTTVASLTENSNEAIQANLVLEATRDELLRMAPWNCGFHTAVATYITSLPGTPENTTAGTSQWAKGLPAPPWAYEYQYPVDCLKMCWVTPQFQTGWSSGVPLYPQNSGGSQSFWNGPPIRFKIAIDQFFPVLTSTVVNGGTGYVLGEQITLAGTVAGSAPIGAPPVLGALNVAAGIIIAAAPLNQIAGSATPQGGSYFARQTNPVAQGSTSGVGVGATFNLTYGTVSSQRVILTNQQNAILNYVKQITDPNLMDPAFIQAWIAFLGARLAFQLTGDTATANLKIGEANAFIAAARKDDANEGLTINDVTPDWIRARGIVYPDMGFTPNGQFDWGAMLTMY